MGDWLILRLGDRLQYIARAHVIDVTFEMSSATNRDAPEVSTATIRLDGPAPEGDVFTIGGPEAQKLYRQLQGEAEPGLASRRRPPTG